MTLNNDNDLRNTWAARLALVNPQALQPQLLGMLDANLTVDPSKPLERVEALPLERVSFRVVDLETSGLSPAHDEIIEVGVYEVLAGQHRKIYQSLIKPRGIVPQRVLDLTGIDPSELECAPELTQEFEAIAQAMRGDCIVAHNATYDVGFLTHAAWRYDPHWVQPPVSCTLRLSRHLLSDNAGFSLLALAERYHFHLPTHRAPADALTTAELLLLLIQRAKDQGAHTLAQFLALEQRKNKPRATPKISPLTVEAVPETAGVYRFYDAQGVLLYVGYSQNLRRRVREHLCYATTKVAKELVARAEQVRYDVSANPLEAFLAEGRAINDEKPLLNVRESEHGKLRYFRLHPQGAVTLVPDARDDEALYVGPLILSRSERDILRAVRRVFKLQARPASLVDPPTPHEGIEAFLKFNREPLGERPDDVDLSDWHLLLDVRRAVHRLESDRIDESRLFRHPTLVIPLTADSAAPLYAVSLGRATLKISPRDLSALAAWLAASPTQGGLDWLGTRISAYARAHPRHLRLLDATMQGLEREITDSSTRVVHGA